MLGLLEVEPQHPLSSSTAGESRALGVHSLWSRGGRHEEREVEGRGWLIALTQLRPKVSCHIPDPAGTLPSPKHGSLGEGEGRGAEWAREVLGQVA